jgi:hypothetical protein
VFGGLGAFGAPDGAGRQVVDLSTLGAAQGFIIQGDVQGDGAGNSVSSLGDINGDGFDDLVVGAQGGDDGGLRAGEAYVVFGGATGTESTLAVSRTGTGAADDFTGNAGDDTFTAIGANDAVRGGAGDDVIRVESLSFSDIDGGRGTDTLALSGSGQSLDLTGPGAAGVNSVEIIDLTGTGNNTVILNRLAVQNLTEERAGGVTMLTVRGNAGDTVSFTEAGWTQGANIVDGTVNYALYANGNTNVRVELGVGVSAPGLAELQGVPGKAQINVAAFTGEDGIDSALADADPPTGFDGSFGATHLLERYALEDRSFDFSRFTDGEAGLQSPLAHEEAASLFGHSFISDTLTFDRTDLAVPAGDLPSFTVSLAHTSDVWDF